MMRNKPVFITFILLAVLLISACGYGMSRIPYYSKNKPKKTEPPPTSPPWSTPAPNGDISVPLGNLEVLYIGLKNTHIPDMKKSVTITVTGPGAHKLHCTGGVGWYTPWGSSSASSTYANKVSKPDKKSGPPESISWTLNFPKQPDWEWIRLRNFGSGQNFSINVETVDECESTQSIGMWMGSEGSFGGTDGMLDYFRITEVSYFPEDAQIDLMSPPTFFAAPHTGNWTHTFQFADPEGNPRPQGGVMWNSDGLGLEGGEPFFTEFAMMPVADVLYSQYIFDAEAGTHHRLLLSLLPLTPWPVTRYDVHCTGRGIADNGAGGTPDWIAPIPGGGTTHGGISILPDGKLVWKSYGPPDGINDGRVYCFDPVTQTIVWDSIATAGIGTGQWAHGGVVVGRDGLYFASRDGTYSVAKLDFNGNPIWLTAFPGIDITVRGTPLLNPSEDRLYARDAGPDGFLYCLDSFSGAVIWSYNMDAAMHGDGAYSSFGMLTGWGTGDFGDMFLYHTTNDADEDICLVDEGPFPSVLWSNAEMNFSWHGSQVYADDSLFCSTFADGGRPSFYKINAYTGETIWSLNAVDGAGNHFCKPAAGPDGTLYVGGHAGKLTAYMDDGLSGHVRWSYTSVGEFNNYVTTAGIGGDAWIYAIRHDSILYAFRDDGVQTDPNIAWTYQLLPGHYFGSFQAAIDEDGGLYLAGGSGNADLGNFLLYHFPPYIEMPAPVIWDVERASLRITWQSVPGATYRVESSTDPYDFDETMMTWTDEAIGIPSGGALTSWEDPLLVPVIEKYYRVYTEDPTGDPSLSVKADDTVGLMWVDVFNGRNMVSSPFEPYPEGGGPPGLSTLDKIVGDQLTGHSAVRSLSDTIEAWDAINQRYLRAWYQTGTGWKDWDIIADPPQFGLDADVGYWFNRVLSHLDTTVMFCGRVSPTDREIPIEIKRNLVGSCFPVSYDLDDSGLVESGFIGHAVVRSLSDTVEFWNNATASYERFWHKTGVGFQPWNIGDPMRQIRMCDGLWVNRPLRTTVMTWTIKRAWIGDLP